ncbi:hypothetical protein ASwh1_124 [Aeromonas phage Aswh_1]|nr:hypothetical protein ASwh1_124 [Aeromonas phage Aswh_1]
MIYSKMTLYIGDGVLDDFEVTMTFDTKEYTNNGCAVEDFQNYSDEFAEEILKEIYTDEMKNKEVLVIISIPHKWAWVRTSSGWPDAEDNIEVEFGEIKIHDLLIL